MGKANLCGKLIAELYTLQPNQEPSEHLKFMLDRPLPYALPPEPLRYLMFTLMKVRRGFSSMFVGKLTSAIALAICAVERSARAEARRGVQRIANRPAQNVPQTRAWRLRFACSVRAAFLARVARVVVICACPAASIRMLRELAFDSEFQNSTFSTQLWAMRDLKLAKGMNFNAVSRRARK